MAPYFDDFLRGTSPGHAVQIYADPAELVDSVAAFLATGFAALEPAVVVATPEHHALFRARLAARGVDMEEIEARGLLVSADAARTLALILAEDGSPSPEAFARVAGRLLDAAGASVPDARVRIFGEMVDLLCADGHVAAAIALEELWCGLAERHDFSLLCGYRLDVFDQEAQASVLPHVCRTHSHVLPARNYARLAWAVDGALDEVLGRDAAARVYLQLSHEGGGEGLPMAQRILMWAAGEAPGHGARILADARTKYAAARPI